MARDRRPRVHLSPLPLPLLSRRGVRASDFETPVAAAAPASAEPQGGARSLLSRPPVAAAPASAEPPGGARSPSSRSFIAAAPALAERPAGWHALAVIEPPRRRRPSLG